MKTKSIFLGLIFIGISTTIFAQNIEQKEQLERRRKEYKKAYLIRELKLSSEQSEKFWSIYNQYQKKETLFAQQFKDRFADHLSEIDSMSTDEANVVLRQVLAAKNKQQELKKAYYNHIASEISPQLALKVINAEKNFKHRQENKTLE